MIYSVHFYYRKAGNRKAAGKFEGIVFAKDRNHAEELVRKMISDYPIKPEEPVSIIGGSDKTYKKYIMNVQSLTE
jgi:type I site-specific restriction endonuclease